MVKETIILEYTCDLCKKPIRSEAYSPAWATLNLNGTGNFDRDGDLINIDLCRDCVKKADKMIVDLFTADKAEEKITEIDENREKIDEKPPIIDGNSEKVDANSEVSEESSEVSEEKPQAIPRKKKEKRGKKSTLDDGKIMALRRAGWTNAKIAEEFGVSGWTIGQHVKKIEAGGAFVENLWEEGNEHII